MHDTLSLRIGAVFITLVASVFGVAFPLVAGKWGENTRILDTDFFRILKCISAGIILSVGFNHTMSDSVTDLSIVQPNYPLGFCLTMIGCILVATVEQVMRHLQVHHVHGHGHVQPTSAESPTRERLQYEVDSEVPSSTPGDSNGSHGPRGHDHRSFSIVAVSLEDEEEGKRLEKEGHAFIKAIVMDASIAVHSVIIGIALGINTSYSSIATLTVAYVFHQGFEGIGLGVAIACSGLTRLQKALLALIFCFTTPIGIAVGAGISSTYNENAAGNLYARGILNALASGNLIYVALVEMMVDDLNDPAVKDRPLFKAGMLFAVALGAAALAIIAIWA